MIIISYIISKWLTARGGGGVGLVLGGGGVCGGEILVEYNPDILNLTPSPERP